MEQPTQFEGWAIVELFGHQREVGFVSTRYFGTACMFQVDVPELPEREATTESPRYIGDNYVPSGLTYKLKKSDARSRLLGPGAIYALNPCTEEAARAALEKLAPRAIVLLKVPEGAPKLNPAPDDEIIDEEFDDVDDVDDVDEEVTT